MIELFQFVFDYIESLELLEIIFQFWDCKSLPN